MEELEFMWRTAADGNRILALAKTFSGFGAAAVLIMVNAPAACGTKLDFAEHRHA
jgi:hypothetical protein